MTAPASAPAPVARSSTAPVAPAKPRRRFLTRTPDKLRLAMGSVLALCLLIGAATMVVTLAQSSAMSATSRETGQIVGLLQARGSLVDAQATATNAFLVGGLEPAELRLRYQGALAEGSSALTTLAGQTDDGDARLSSASSGIAVYSGLIEQARANNRQGFPVGTAYLNQASQALTTQVLAPIDETVIDTANASANDFALIAGMPNLRWGLIVAALVLIGVQVWLTRRTRRTFNVPMLAGTVVFAIAALYLANTVQNAADVAAATRESSYRATLATAQAVSLVAEARSDEAFGLIRRGSGATYETDFDAAITQARADLQRSTEADWTTASQELPGLLEDWVTQHDEIRALDDGGDWDGAVALATSSGEGSPAAAYQAFVDTATDYVAEQSNQIQQTMASQGSQVVLAGWLMVIAAIACAAGSWFGLSRRLEEYR